MNNDTTPVTSGPTFVQRSRKALAAGVGGAVAAAGSAAALAAADGLTESELWSIVGAAVGGFVLAFGTTWAAPANAR